MDADARQRVPGAALGPAPSVFLLLEKVPGDLRVALSGGHDPPALQLLREPLRPRLAVP